MMSLNHQEYTFPDEVPVLSSKRLNLVELTEDHVKDIFEIYSNDYVTKYDDCYSFTSINHALDAINLFKQSFENRTGIRWGISIKNEKKIIGNIGFSHFEPFHTGKVGFALNVKYWNMGICTEAIREVLQFGFNVLKIHRVEAESHPKNIASGQVLEKNGFKKEGRLRDFAFWKGSHQTIDMYSKLSQDPNN
ncbi:MAG: N-acetyltransferase [Calditrichaeota bacterium]|nr:MAG: N-acetyltransferase [Calditrichota bacterium]MBL1207190.1 N-acetyltransferase [Calditrichota bacterium]NOG47023.1 GNAT family N-acetyltransferase [Calditrichota bacterium]